MESLRHLLPSARALIAFEAAGRLGSFTRAAAELGLSQAAVSLAVKGLEDSLAVRLFHRRHRQVELTEAGARFHADVMLGLGHIRKSAEELRALGSDRHVTLFASTAFASFWMLPRLAQLREDLPDIDLRIQTGDRDFDLAAENIPLGVRSGPAGGFAAYEAEVLAPERIAAVASPAYVARFGRPRTPAEVASQRLIHLEEPYRPCTDWGDWFASVGLPRPPRASGLVINDYVLVVQAVMEGQGIALGWQHLTDRLVGAGLLLPVGGHVLETDQTFQLIWPRGRALAPPALRVRDWLLDQRDR
ncbi:LysR substrate-binding domain-containing protein [Stappia indica]|uniref:LysR substrate-binding domain-containing protein n=1 Tax=Stappia indica TaxID=538381 RepID=UPI001CD3B3C4|nr:LysR substrate-binding domain-containing protein [Stappia indica]MCA1300143.1 LysR family transcriptional regulator [Stappia indica]